MSREMNTPAIDEPFGKTAPHKTAAEVLMLVTTFCWASNIVAGKEALRGFSPLALAQLRMSVAALLYGALFLLWRERPKLHMTRRQWLLLGLMGLTGITLNQICFLGGLARTSVAHTGLIQAVGPIMVLLLSAFIGREAPTLQNCGGMAIAFAGVAVLLTGKSGSENGAHWSGDLILLAAGASFAFYTILMKDVACDYDALTLSMLVFGLGAALLTPFCLGSVAAVDWQHIPIRAWVGLAYMVVFGSVVAYLIYAFALSILSASKAAAFAYLQPVIAVGLGVWLIGERITSGAIAGGALILLGVYLTERKRARGQVTANAKKSELVGGATVRNDRPIRGWRYARSFASSLSAFGHDCCSEVTVLKECRRLIIAPFNALNHTDGRVATYCFRNATAKKGAARARGRNCGSCASPGSRMDKAAARCSHERLSR